MTQSNHITGGTVFTGIFASLWDINIFSDINLLVVCWFASVLPDIDHTKSPIGKMFYPLAKFLDKKFGHRTITHSLLFVVASILVVKAILPFNFTLVFAFGLISHLLFDMVTVQGVPLLYPFKKNPCVLPGNPEARIRSGNTRAELTAFVLFIVCGTFCYPLMANGFWMSFNNTLGSKKQLIAEFKRSDNILLVNYDFRRDFENFKGFGYCLSAKDAKVVFLDTAKGFVTMVSDDVPRSFSLAKSKYTSLDQLSVELKFKDITMAQVDSVLKSRPVLKGKISANRNARFLVNGEEQHTNYLKLDCVNDLRAIEEIEKFKRIDIKSIQLRQLEDQFQFEMKSFREDLLKQKALKEEYQNATDFRKSEINRELQKINPTKPDERSYIHAKEILQAEIKSLEEEKLKVSGSIRVVQI